MCYILSIGIAQMICLIYKITNILNGKVYIGQTWNPLHVRFRRHSNKASHFSRITNSIKKHGKENFTIEAICITNTQPIANYWESFFINRYKSMDRAVGYNGKEGGSNGKHSEETKLKLSLINKGKVLTEECKRKLSEAKKGLKLSEATRLKIKEANTGKVRSEQSRQNYTNARTGTHLSDETKKKISDSRKGQKSSKEARDNMSKAGKGRKQSAEHVKKKADALRGRPLSEETKKKMSESAKKHSKKEKI